MRGNFSVTGKVWKYPGAGGWFFVYVGKKESLQIKNANPARVGFGFIKTRAALGNTTWDTSLFPTKEGPYLIAIKNSVRRSEGVKEGDTLHIAITLL